jgi:hypothetical protein
VIQLEEEEQSVPDTPGVTYSSAYLKGDLTQNSPAYLQ